jgi:hypothetical protein
MQPPLQRTKPRRCWLVVQSVVRCEERTSFTVLYVVYSSLAELNRALTLLLTSTHVRFRSHTTHSLQCMYIYVVTCAPLCDEPIQALRVRVNYIAQKYSVFVSSEVIYAVDCGRQNGRNFTYTPDHLHLSTPPTLPTTIPASFPESNLL